MFVQGDCTIAPGDAGACPGFKRPILWVKTTLQLLGRREMREMRMKLGNHGTLQRWSREIGEGWAGACTVYEAGHVQLTIVCKPNGQGVGVLPEALINW